MLNEASFTAQYIISLRAALDEAGFHTTKLIASDQVGWDIYDAIAKNATLSEAVDVLGDPSEDLVKNPPAVPTNTAERDKENREREKQAKKQKKRTFSVAASSGPYGTCEPIGITPSCRAPRQLRGLETGAQAVGRGPERRRRLVMWEKRRTLPLSLEMR